MVDGKWVNVVILILAGYHAFAFGSTLLTVFFAVYVLVAIGDADLTFWPWIVIILLSILMAGKRKLRGSDD